MRNTLALISITAFLTTPAIAQARGFNSNFTQQVAGPVKVEVLVSEDLAHRANHLPKKLSDRGARSRLNSAFANNGKYGEKEISYLVEKLSEELNGNFARRGIAVSDSAPTLIQVTIEKAKPNRPTFKQLSNDSSLSFQSFGIGGAELSVDILSADGELIGEADYDYFSTLNDHPFRPIGTWTDASRAFSRFSSKLSKKIAAQSAPAS